MYKVTIKVNEDMKFPAVVIDGYKHLLFSITDLGNWGVPGTTNCINIKCLECFGIDQKNDLTSQYSTQNQSILSIIRNIRGLGGFVCLFLWEQKFFLIGNVMAQNIPDWDY